MPLRRSEQWFQQNPHEGEALQQAYRELDALRSELQAVRAESVKTIQGWETAYQELSSELHAAQAASDRIDAQRVEWYDKFTAACRKAAEVERLKELLKNNMDVAVSEHNRLQAALDEANGLLLKWKSLSPSSNHHGPDYIARDVFLAAQEKK